MILRNLMGLIPWILWLFLIGGIASLAVLTIYLIVHIG